MTKFKYKNGEKVKDLITSFSGTIIGRVDYLTGCIQYLISPKMKAGENVCPAAEWLDEDRLKLTAHKPVGIKVKSPGFCKAAPKK